MVTPPGPRRYVPTPLDGPELHVHPQRCGALDPGEKRLVALFLTRYVVWCGRTGRVDRLRNAVDLLAELAGQSFGRQPSVRQ